MNLYIDIQYRNLICVKESYEDKSMYMLPKNNDAEIIGVKVCLTSKFVMFK